METEKISGSGLNRILFLDIETVPLHYRYADLPEKLKGFWDRKAAQLSRHGETPEEVYQKSGIFAEFSKVICISAGFFTGSGKSRKFRIKSFFGDNEATLLLEFAELLNKHFKTDKHLLCAHNGKEFDYPFLCRRMLINGISLPDILDISGKKPWDVRHLDTMEMWKFGDHKNFTSLDLLAYLFNIPTPKNDMDGSMVKKVYYEEKNLERIVNYCQKDVITVARLYLSYRGLGSLTDGEVLVV